MCIYIYIYVLFVYLSIYIYVYIYIYYHYGTIGPQNHSRDGPLGSNFIIVYCPVWVTGLHRGLHGADTVFGRSSRGP